MAEDIWLINALDNNNTTGRCGE